MPDAPVPPSPPDAPSSHPVWKLLRDVAIDPTTYAPGLAKYLAGAADWKTSQPLFEHGWMEANPEFTASGEPNSAPKNYRDGMAVIRNGALKHVAIEAGNNALVDAVTRKLMDSHPDRATLIRALGWAEKIGLSGLESYWQGQPHYAQAQRNKALAKDHGF